MATAYAHTQIHLNYWPPGADDSVGRLLDLELSDQNEIRPITNGVEIGFVRLTDLQKGLDLLGPENARLMEKYIKALEG